MAYEEILTTTHNSNSSAHSSLFSAKQNTISDLETIRSGASAGATAIQNPASKSSGQVLTYNGSSWVASTPSGGATVVSGTYSGTGTYGSSNPTSITFASAPKVVWVAGGSNGKYLQWSDGITNGVDVNFGDGASRRFSVSGNTLSWWTAKSASVQNQLNESGYTYKYFAIL